MTFLTPSLAWLVFYELSFVALVALSAIVNKTTDMGAFRETFDITKHTWQFGVIIIFYLLHMRELKRFYEQ